MVTPTQTRARADRAGARRTLGLAGLLIAALAAPAPLISDGIGSADAPWFNMTNCHDPSRTTARSSGSRDGQGGVLCELTIAICGDVIYRHKTIDPRTEHCPASLRFTSAPSRPVCCERWRSSKAPDSRCNGTIDADCDGIPNDRDDQPLTPNGPTRGQSQPGGNGSANATTIGSAVGGAGGAPGGGGRGAGGSGGAPTRGGGSSSSASGGHPRQTISGATGGADSGK